MKYKLYIIDDCRSCGRILDLLRRLGVAFLPINLSDPDAARPDFLMVVPALLENEKLVAYGPDIPDYLSRKTA